MSPYEEIRDRQYYKQLNYENTLAAQINRIAAAVSENNKPNIVYTVTALAYMLPMDMRKKTFTYMKDKNIIYDTSNDGIKKWLDLWGYCEELLEKGDLIFKIGKGPSEFGTM